MKKVVSELKDELPAKLDHTKYTRVAEYVEAVEERELEIEATNDLNSTKLAQIFMEQVLLS